MTITFSHTQNTGCFGQGSAGRGVGGEDSGCRPRVARLPSMMRTFLSQLPLGAAFRGASIAEAAFISSKALL